jgi:hypothetical protein
LRGCSSTRELEEVRGDRERIVVISERRPSFALSSTA